MSTVKIVPLAPSHRDAWEQLYKGYAEFYRVDQTEEMRDRVWSWLMDEAHEETGLVALDEAGVPVGLAHVRPFARPLSATTGLFLDDLFVDPACRGQGIADRLLEALRDMAAEKGYSVVRWITAENNYRARGAYDRIATRTNWLTYDIKV